MERRYTVARLRELGRFQIPMKFGLEGPAGRAHCSVLHQPSPPLISVVPIFSPTKTNRHHQQQTLAPPPPPELDHGSAMPPPPARLLDDPVEEVLLRFPPKDPAALVRAALVCKRWRRLVSGPGFRRRFAEFHRTPPMLGVFCRRESGPVDPFVPTAAFRPHLAERAPYMRVLDARHGRVLFRTGPRALVVWDPITDEEWKVPFPLGPAPAPAWTAAVLCSAASCNHLDCHSGPFIVVFASTVFGTYSSDAAAWSEPICAERPGYYVDPWKRSALVGSALYFQGLTESTALKYNLESHQISWVSLPTCHQQSVLTAMEDGGLGLVTKQESKLEIWSSKEADEVDAIWEQNRVINLRTLLPVDADLASLIVVGSTDDLDTIFVSVDSVAYAIDLKTDKAKNLYRGTVTTIIPYMSFYTPALQADDTGDGGGGGSSA